MVELVGFRGSSGVLFVFSDVFNLVYVFVNIRVDVDIVFYEMFDFNFLEFVFVDDSSDSYFLLEIV